MVSIYSDQRKRKVVVPYWYGEQKLMDPVSIHFCLNQVSGKSLTYNKLISGSSSESVVKTTFSFSNIVVIQLICDHI